MKAMMIGLGPEYNYPGILSKWGGKYNTRYASNFGASLISRSLMKQFGAEYIDDFSDIPSLKNKFDTCFVAFANHVTNWRDVSIYADVIEKLDMKTVALSLGVQDYVSDANIEIHPSMSKLLKLVSERSNVIGVRGHHTAGILYRHGIKNVVPVGCPTMFWNLNENISIEKSESFKNPVLVYHRTIASVRPDLFEDSVLLGQDFLDEVVMRNDPNNDAALLRYELGQYSKQGLSVDVLERVRKNSIFARDFSSWFDLIAGHDFVFGPRLHGCIAGLIQGIPSVMLARDIRTSEIAEMFDIPYFPYSKIRDMSVADFYAHADFSKFAETYRRRYKNYQSVIAENNLVSNLVGGESAPYTYDSNDLRSAIFSANFKARNVEKRSVGKSKLDSIIRRLRRVLRGRKG